MLSVYELYLDVQKNGQQGKINARLGDNASRQVNIHVHDNGGHVSLAEAGVQVYMKKPDGTKIYQACEVGEDDIVTFTTTAQCCTAAGIVLCELQIVQDGRILYSPQFAIEVENTVYDENAVESTDEWTALESFLTDLLDLKYNAERVINKYPEIDEDAPGVGSYPTVQAVIDYVCGKEETIKAYADGKDTALANALNVVIASKEALSNKTTSIGSGSTDTQYPSAKAVYTAINTIYEELSQALTDHDSDVDAHYEAFTAHDNDVKAYADSVVSTHDSDSSAHADIFSGYATTGDLADALSAHDTDSTAHADKEVVSNKTTTVDSSSTDTQYPSAKAVYTAIQGGGGGGTTDYNELDNKPKINSVELSGNKSLSALGAETTSNKTTTVNSSSTDTQYPTAKAVHTAVNAVDTEISTHEADSSAHSAVFANYATTEDLADTMSTHDADSAAHYDAFSAFETNMQSYVSGEIITHNNDSSAHADKEVTSNKVTSISSSSTDTQYPSAKAVYTAIQGGGGGGTTDYNELDNKPKINSVELSGNKSLSELGVESTSNKTTTLNSSSTDTQYPTAKTVYSNFYSAMTAISSHTGDSSAHAIQPQISSAVASHNASGSAHADIRTLVNGKNKTFVGSTTPVSPNEGDLWIQPDTVVYQNDSSYSTGFQWGTASAMPNPATLQGDYIHIDGRGSPAPGIQFELPGYVSGKTYNYTFKYKGALSIYEGGFVTLPEVSDWTEYTMPMTVSSFYFATSGAGADFKDVKVTTPSTQTAKVYTSGAWVDVKATPPTASQTVLGGVKMWLTSSGGSTTLNISTE